MAMGRFEEALSEGRVAIELDPGSVSIRRSMGWLQYYSRQYEAALENLRRALTMDPTAEETHRLLALVYLQQGRYDEAAAAFREASPTHRTMRCSPSPGWAMSPRGGAGRKRRGRFWRSFRSGPELRYVSPVARPGLYVTLGRAETAAFEWLGARRTRIGVAGWPI